MMVNVPLRVLAFPESVTLAYYNSMGDDRLDDAPESMTSRDYVNSVGVAVWRIEKLIKHFKKSSNPLWLWEAYRAHRWTCHFARRPDLTREAFTASKLFAEHPYRERVIDYLYASADVPSTIAVYLDMVAENLLGIPLSRERLLEGEGVIVREGPHEGEQILFDTPESAAYALLLKTKHTEKAKGGKRVKGGGHSLYPQYLKDRRDDRIYDYISAHMEAAHADHPDTLDLLGNEKSKELLAPDLTDDEKLFSLCEEVALETQKPDNVFGHIHPKPKKGKKDKKAKKNQQRKRVPRHGGLSADGIRAIYDRLKHEDEASES